MSDSMLLTSDISKAIYTEIKDLPIIDYHTHLPPSEILQDHRFENIWELWLKHDHYKWRLMRGCGVEERFITGDASPKEKFFAFATILPLAIGNPVYQWVQMELEMVFGIQTRLHIDTAEEIWQQTNDQLANRITVRTLLKQFRVQLIGTTDDPADSLQDHLDLAAENLSTQVLPTFRPDRFLRVDQPEKFRTAIDELAACVHRKIGSFEQLLDALHERHNAFGLAGCLMSDHGLDYCPTGNAKLTELDQIFQESISGQSASMEKRDQFAAEIMRSVGRWNAEKGWTMQLHLGPQRGVNTRLVKLAGPDSGFDTMGSWPQTDRLISFLDELDRTGDLPKTIVYHLNPMEGESICAALQNFQEGPIAGKLQYGPAWWLLDHVSGIKRQLEILTSQAALGTHTGMLTDSRSFTSFVRHDYYRRILSSFLADKMISGEIPHDLELITTTAKNISFQNIAAYLKPNDSSA